ncbi:MAG: response regulator [Ktedonobacteraceae bacterium]|nr:response regulator [Ktedonobacteraceae bacterium]
MQQKILVIDDDESILEVIQIVLESAGYQIQISQSGECFQHFTNCCLPDLILLDVLLSGEDGREICKTLKRNQTTAHIPVVILSALSDTSKLVDVSGADDFLEKPFDVDVLIETVEKHLLSA